MNINQVLDELNLTRLLEELRMRSAAEWIREGWQRLQPLPGGSRLFDRLIGLAIPYTGSLGAEVVHLERGHARVRLRDRRAVRNHLDSIHAIALANLAELTGNLALVYSLPKDGRFIVKALAIEYMKKARGTILGECRCEPIDSSERREYELTVELTDDSGALVARARLTTLVGPVASPGN